MSSSVVTFSPFTTLLVMLAREFHLESEVLYQPYLLTISIRTPLRSFKMQCIKRTRMETFSPSISKLTTSWSPRWIFNPLTQWRRKPVSPFRSQWIWPSRSRLALRKPPLSIRLCVSNKKPTACCNVWKFRQKFKTRKSTRTSGNSRPRMRASAQLVSLLPTPVPRLKPIWSRLRLRSMRHSSSLTPKGSRRLLISILLDSNMKMKSN